MLQLEPPRGYGSHAKANLIMDCHPDPATGRLPDPRTSSGWEERIPFEWVDGTGEKRLTWTVRPGPVRVEAFRRVRQDWERRGLVKITFNDAGEPVATFSDDVQRSALEGS